MAKSITIIGGGLAGLTLGISLRREGISVRIYEAGHYPRHRVCGEFISGSGQQVLARLELLDHFRQAGALPGETAAFIAGSTCSPIHRVRPPALCLSRWTMDALLAKTFQEAGGELCQGERRRDGPLTEGLVRATGRQLHPSENGWRWLGFKIHARQVSLGADVEMHLVRNGYIGVSRIEGDAVNICGLFRRPTHSPKPIASGREWLRGEPGSLLCNRLANASFDETSFCAVAGLGLRPQRAASRAECCLGDALTMIPPVTGNGMSMAFEGAELATGFLAAYSRGKVSWDETRATIARACDNAFGRRLAWAGRLQWLMFSPLARGSLGRRVLGSSWIWHIMFARTRG